MQVENGVEEDPTRDSPTSNSRSNSLSSNILREAGREARHALWESWEELARRHGSPQVSTFAKNHLGMEVEADGCKRSVTTFIVEPFVAHTQEYYLCIVSERLGCIISFSECGWMEIEENWDIVKIIFIPTEESFTADTCASLVATLPLEVKHKIEEFMATVFAFLDLDFTSLR